MLYRLEYFIQNNDFMKIGVKIPIREAIVLDFRTAYADSFWQEYPACILLVGQQFIESLSIPFGLTRGG